MRCQEREAFGRGRPGLVRRAAGERRPAGIPGCRFSLLATPACVARCRIQPKARRAAAMPCSRRRSREAAKPASATARSIDRRTKSRTTRSSTANPPRPAPIAARSAMRRPPMLEIPSAHPIDPAQKRSPHAPGNAVISPDMGGIEDRFASQRRHVCSPCLQMCIRIHSCQAPDDEKSPKGRRSSTKGQKHARRSKR